LPSSGLRDDVFLIHSSSHNVPDHNDGAYGPSSLSFHDVDRCFFFFFLSSRTEDDDDATVTPLVLILEKLSV
jgi:hypothetical protein